MTRGLTKLGLLLVLSACASPAPLYTGQSVDGRAATGSSILYLDVVVQNRPGALAGWVLPKEMLLFEIDPLTGRRGSTPPWSVGLCRTDFQGCELGETKTLRLSLPAGVYAIGYIGVSNLASPSDYLLQFDDQEPKGGSVLLGGMILTADFSGPAQATSKTPILEVRPNEVAYAGVLSVSYRGDELVTSVSSAPERRSMLVAQTGLSPATLVERTGYYR